MNAFSRVRARFQNPVVLFASFLLAFCVVLGALWLQQGVSNQEFTANHSKALDYLHGVISVKGWPWWTPSFNFGHSLADSLSTMVAYVALLASEGLFGVAAGAKLLGLACLMASGAAMFFFVRRLTSDVWCAFAASVLYVICPQFALRLAFNEHLIVAMCFIYPPLIFWALLEIAKENRWRDILLLALLYAAMTLTYVRIAVAFLPAMAAFALWIFITQPDRRANLLRGILRAAWLFLPLAALPLLPLLRESQWMAFFRFDPFQGWQKSFSLKTALSWLDRSGVVFEGKMPPWFAVGRGPFYLGVEPMLSLAAFFLWRGRKEAWQSSAEGRLIRLFLAISLLLMWLSYGPRSILAGHIEFLQNAANALDWSVPVAWLLLFAQGFIVARLWPQMPRRALWVALSLVVYFLVPGFVLLEKIPFYSPIRAPWSFWEVGGSFTFAVAAGISIPLIVRSVLPTVVLRWVFGAVLLILSLMDMGPYHAYFAKESLPKGTFEDFLETQRFLASQSKPGRANFLSGRYFYLLTPSLSQRGLMCEAFHGHYTLSWTRQLIETGSQLPALFRSQYDLMGISYVVLDKEDPDTPLLMQEYFRTIFPVAFENKHFAVLENKQSLAPAFIGKEFIVVQPDSEKIMPQMLSASRANYVSVEMQGVEMSLPDLVGVENAQHQLQWKGEFQNKTGEPFRVHAEVSRRDNFHEIRVNNLPNDSGRWLIIPEAFHPDWTARADGKPLVVSKAFGSLLAVMLPAQTREVVFEFKPPRSYSLVLTASLLCWIVGLLTWGALASASRLKNL
ncbi:MAG: hypothetical protein V1746_06950 [bacterium]